ncbi:MAG: hypothetical protein IKN65_04695 [Clostridia bacterium]|nr:hypothetical protein [Clostridia bacterium]
MDYLIIWLFLFALCIISVIGFATISSQLDETNTLLRDIANQLKQSKQNQEKD